VKYGIPLAAILLIGIAVGVHPAFVAPGDPERRLPAPPGIPPGSSSSDHNGRTREASSGGAEATPLSGAAATVVPSKGVSPPSWRTMNARLIQDVSLTLTQQAMVEEILRDRHHEIRQFHELLRSVGAIDLRQYDWKTSLMKESWFRKIDALLDRPQHEAFVILVQRGFLNEGLDFVVEPGMTVID
jgi:hypothetical protein